MHTRVLFLVSLALFFAPHAWAQTAQPVSADASILEVSGQASESIPPNGVSVEFLVFSHQESLAEAAEETDAKAEAVVAALDELAIADLEVSRVGYQIGPDWQADSEGNRIYAGYAAHITIRTKTSALDRTGRIAETGITAGAREIRGIRFTSSRMVEARRSALRAAVVAARLDAETMADAAGGTLGRLLLLTTESRFIDPVLVRSFGSGRAPNEITPEELRVGASVKGRWEFVPASDSGNP
ncbi:MAG: SIMPL domain-containing protein [Gemmatimonadota bacterium]